MRTTTRRRPIPARFPVAFGLQGFIRRMRTTVIGPNDPPPTSAQFVPSSYFIRLPRSWSLTSKFDF